VVPAAATLYVMGLELPASAACGFDLSCMDKYRCDVLATEDAEERPLIDLALQAESEALPKLPNRDGRH